MISCPNKLCEGRGLTRFAYELRGGGVPETGIHEIDFIAPKIIRFDAKKRSQSVCSGRDEMINL